MSYNDSDIHPTNVFFSPLLLPQWHRISGQNVIEVLVDGNDYLRSFVKTLDHEIIYDQPALEHKDFCEELINALRTFGWCVPSFYDEDSDIPYFIWLPTHFESWIKSIDKEMTKDGDEIEVIHKTGAIFHRTDDLGNVIRESCYFADQFNEDGEIAELQSYFLIWRRGNGRQKRYLSPDTTFALSDLDLGILTSAIAAHQVKAAIETGGAKPFFLHFKYGTSITTQQADKVRNQIGYIGPSAGFGASINVVDEIVKIENADIQNSIAALQELKSGFSAMTRLPLSFYNGERKKGGLGDSGEDADEGDVTRVKEEILSHFNEVCGDMLALELGITLDTELYQKMKAEADAKEEERLLAKSITMDSEIQDGQEN
jgi:hypothetical protein